MESKNADIVLGSRLHEGSRMPAVRWVGNTVFSLLLSFFSSSKIKDTASGMRIVRRSVLPKILPLPSGLDFTPAMSAKAILRPDVVISEIDMPYSEREGQSKLNVLTDGARFLAVIFDAVLVIPPGSTDARAGHWVHLIATALMIGPFLNYMHNQRVEEWMIYRFVVSHFLATAGLIAISAAYVSNLVAGLSGTYDRENRLTTVASRLLRNNYFWLVPVAFLAGAIGMVVHAAMEYAETGHVYEHWSRFIFASFLGLCSAFLILTRILDHSIRHLWRVTTKL